MAKHNPEQDRKNEQKEELKRIKKLAGSALVALPALQDQTSELLRTIGVFTNGSDNKR